MDMQSTFLLACIFPPPTTSPEILTWSDGSGARRASDTHKTFVMKRVVWDLMVLDVISDFCIGPQKEGIVFKEGIIVIPLQDLHRLPVCGMFFSQPGYPH